jgi:glucokinase
METPQTNGAVIGVDLGGTKLSAGLFDSTDTLIARELTLVGGLNQDQLVDALAQAVGKLIELTDEPVLAAGFGVPTTIDQRTGIAVQAANLPIKDLALREVLTNRTGLPIFLDNDANVAALAEQRLGAGAQADEPVTDLIMVTLGTGFGGGIVIDGKIVAGHIGAGAELGHMSIEHAGLPCVSPNCPGIGCIETYAGGTALARDAQLLVEREPQGALARAVADGSEARGETVLRLAKAGDSSCMALFQEMGERLGTAFFSLVNIFNPQMIAVGGGMSPALDLLLPIATDVVRRRALAPGNDYVQIVKAAFGPDAGMVGAALMARDGVRAHQVV